MTDPAVRRVVDALPPATWDCSVWLTTDERRFVNGRIDRADVHRIVTAVLELAYDTRHLSACPLCHELVLVAVHDTGNPLRVDPEPDAEGWLSVWHEDGMLRVSGHSTEHVDAVHHHPHRCR